MPFILVTGTIDDGNAAMMKAGAEDFPLKDRLALSAAQNFGSSREMFRSDCPRLQSSRGRK